jgi:hypothetical protein
MSDAALPSRQKEPGACRRRHPTNHRNKRRAKTRARMPLPSNANAGRKPGSQARQTPLSGDLRRRERMATHQNNPPPTYLPSPARSHCEVRRSRACEPASLDAFLPPPAQADLTASRLRCRVRCRHIGRVRRWS